MPIATIPLTSFTGGEWSPRLHGRVDQQRYSSACEILQNMVIYPHGGITRRMGMEYIGDAKTLDVRLIPFEYNREQAYVLEFGNQYVRFFRDGGQIVSGVTPVEVASPYLAIHIPDISFVQSGDTLYLVHPLYAPRKLTRPGADTFTLATVTFTGAPGVWVANNYPGAVTFFQNRLVFGGTPKEPQTLWMSKVGLFETFTPGTPGALTDADPVTVTLSASQVNSINWLISGKKLFIGSTGGEWSLQMPTNAVGSVFSQRESNYGSKTGRVQLVGNGVIYASRDGKKLREMAYRYESDGFDSPELSLFSEHLTRLGIKEFDYAQNPDGVLWVVMNDGSFSGLTYLKSQEVQAWHRHETNGFVMSVCTIEGATSTETWFAVLRNGGIRIEKLSEAFEGISPNDVKCAYLDSFLSYSGAPATTLSGLAHLNGMTVSVLADGQYLADKVVVSGSITLEVAASKVVVGLPYEWKLKPLRLEGGSPSGFSQGKMKSVDSVIVRLERSAGIKHRIPNSNVADTTPVPDRNFGENFNSSVDLFTGDIEIKLNPTWGRDGQFELSGDSPFPVTILMIAAKVMVNE